MPQPALITRCAIALVLITTASGLAQDFMPPDPRIESSSGRDRRVWPPDRPFDHVDVRLDIDIPSMGERGFTAVQTIRLNPVARPRDSITLDAGGGLVIHAITIEGRHASFEHADGQLVIDLDPPRSPGHAFDLRISYTGERPGAFGKGLSWVGDDPDTPETDFMMFAQGQPQTNHLWFPCHDFPNERVACQLAVTVEDPYEAVSNGSLLAVTRSGGRSTYHWRLDEPHAYYLVTLAVGRFDVVNLGGPESARPGLWMPVYGPLGSADLLRLKFADTPAMVVHFEALFDEPFPWDKYAQIVVRGLDGAMENTSASTFSADMLFGPGDFFLSVVVHELVHQWFGDLVTCSSWEHLWLNEGWATYGEALWAEHVGGRDAYRRAIRQAFRMQVGSGGIGHPRVAGMASNRYALPMQRFMSANNVYQKGSIVLHMLRRRLGDEVFFRAIRLYLDRFKHDTAETNDFRRVLEEVSGESLERFFDQWVYRPGHPSIELDYQWDAGSGELTVRVEQTQTIDADNPAFAFALPLYVETTGGSPPTRVYVPIDEREASLTVRLGGEPVNIIVNPDMTVLVRHRVRTDLAGAAPADRGAE